LGSIMIPGQVLWVPKFLILNQIGLVDNLFGIALPNLADVFGVFFMTQFFKSLPKELEEAASIDGAGTFRTFRQIILPNAYPALDRLPELRHPHRREQRLEGMTLSRIKGRSPEAKR